MIYSLIHLLESLQRVFYFQMESIIIPVILILIILLITKQYKICLCIIVLFFLFLRARYVEPFWINIRETEIGVGFTGNYILIADLHLGQNKKQEFLSDVVNKINHMKHIDGVLIAGDFMMEPKKEDISEIYKPLSQLKYPVYAVLGNHDVEKPGPPYRQELVQALMQNNVKIMNNQIEKLPNGIILVGIGDNWGREDDTMLLDQLGEQNNVISLLHNPDSVLKYTNNHADLTLAGHTHCGQIKIPRLWKSRNIIPVSGPYLCGYYQDPRTQVYITAGLGETSIPFRLFNRATIDIIHLR